MVRKVAVKGNALAGVAVGCKDSCGYLTVSIDRKRYKVHRIVWFWHHGYFPEHEIDHINRNRTDNRIENLREVTRSCNMRNSRDFSTNTSGVKGVYWYAAGRKWQAIIYAGKRPIYLGRSDDFMEAACLRLAAEQSLGWAGCDGSSPAFQYVQANIGRAL